MHAHGLAHLDLNTRNVMVDGGRYACIDYETSHRFHDDHPRIQGVRSCDPPPEVGRGGYWDPYKADVRASGMMILRVLQVRTTSCCRYCSKLNMIVPVNWSPDMGTPSLLLKIAR